MIRRFSFPLALAVSLLAVAPTGHAERAWVKDELRLNLRTGPGVQYRILGVVETGDSVEVLSRQEGWTQVRGREGLEGWIPEGYLQAEAPARIQLERHEADTEGLRGRFQTISQEVEELRSRNQELSTQETDLKQQVTRLGRENLELRAGARWPEWVAGASILFVGVLLGIFFHWSTTRRTTRRIRL